MKVNFKSGQISIFIIIAITIVILFIFLISSDSQDKTKSIENSKKISSLDQEILPITDKVNFCLDREIKKALIISGMKGGFIYQRYEYFTNPITFDSNNIYNYNFLKNLNLNLMTLSNGVLIHSQVDLFSPNFNSSVKSRDNSIIIYNYSITDEFEEYVMDEFVKCIDLWDYQNLGFNVTYDDFVGRLESISNTGVLSVYDIDAEVGDKVEVNYGNKKYLGNVTNNIGRQKVEINMIDNFVPNANTNFEDIYIRNLETDVNININFDEKGVKASMNFPIKVQRDDEIYSVGDIEYSVDSDFFNLLKISKLLLIEKNENRSLDFSNSSDFNYILNKYNSLFDSNFLDNLILTKIVLNNTDIYKKFIYSLKDNSGKILGSPYIFNFAYENHAPDVIMINNNYAPDLYFQLSENTTYNLNLSIFTHDKEFLDIYTKRFIPQSYNSTDGKFSINSNGNILFIGYEKKNYNFEIQVTDGEAIRTKRVIFSTGFPDNINNKAAKDCFDFKNYGVRYLSPIEDDYKNKIFNYTAALNKNHIYSYFINQKGLGSQSWQPFELKFFKSCLFDENYFDLNVKLFEIDGITQISGVTWNSTSQIIKGLPEDKSFKVSVEITAKNTGGVVTDPFVLNVYTVDCLGPRGNSSAISEYGGDLTCCNLGPIDTQISTNPPAEINNMYEVSHVALDADLYFTLNLFYNRGYDWKNDYLWDKLNGNPTAVYSGNMKATCGGKFSHIIPNIDGVTGGNDLSFTKDGINYNLGIAKSYDKCTASELDEILGSVQYDDNADGINIAMDFGLQSKNTLNTLKISNDFFYDSNEYFLADKGWFGSKNSGTYNFFSGSFTDSTQGMRLEVGKKFCSAGGQGEVLSSSGFYYFRDNNQPQCKQYTFFTSSESFSSIRAGASWSCTYSGMCLTSDLVETDPNTGVVTTTPQPPHHCTLSSNCADNRCQ